MFEKPNFSKRMNRYFLKGVAISILLFHSIFIHAQVNEQVEVKRQFKPVLGEALKIRKSPYFPEETAKTIQPTYGFKDISLKKDTAANSIQADSLHRKDTAKILPIYLNAAVGSHKTLIGELYFNTLPSPIGSFSANIRHLSLAGKLQNEKFSTDQLNLDGKKTLDDNYLAVHFGVEQKSNPFYGYDNSKYSYTASEVKQQFRNIVARLDFGKLDDTAQGMHYFAKIGGYYFGDSYSSSETHLDAFGGLAYSWDNYRFNVQADLQNNILTTSPSKFNTSLGRFKPSFTFLTDILRVDLGLNIVYEIGDRSQAYVFPDLQMDLQMSEVFSVYGGIKGDILQNTYKNLAALNPYLLPSNGRILNSNFNLQNTKQSILVYAGIKGNINPDMTYKAQIDVSQMDRVPFFENTLAPIDNFTLAYDGNGTILTKLYGELNYIPSDLFRLNTNITFMDYRLSNLPKAFYTPGFKLQALGTYTPLARWSYKGSLSYISSQAVPFIPTGSSSYTSIKSYIDLNFGVEYKLSHKLAVYLQGNNLFDNKYMLFYNYPVIGLNVLAGLSLRY